MARRRKVTATFFDEDGYPFVTFKGTKQDVADAASLYVLNVGNPLSGTESPFEISRHHDSEESEEQA